ncbi:multifunctional CCA addition/repair protein [Kingella kingae]|uniref:multifunctional CCA addition/repair protein n=1 Tax=Kingella kingae TaxID=504 RepID=UPI0002584B09|nr:multifunctional CCA addition/repair protein [Kingella kingae]EIC14114.1 multifunctional tRNA nucleotidyl transferase/2'3'-cyclic phosphodiesterase/2'nucleotidase/phosphatase [Kingella kingae PYKK081]MDK4568625.1 multifunctional CCA addition/repair protein [Kingella kingae]MDK4570536.1 multifunctional CCA addition/repair protein [Kingella kingae]MDK4572416.1 multifunctional CCA addition/repair protein [Kingella kingae]MDK4598613.1 multifunctional CCA addition/repair protein [Kingella kingae]
MQIYLVGGAVRDTLLGKNVQDRDWVVVGAEASTLLAQGFTAVGKDFPVFLHPKTHEEYALARTERKTGKGYTAFAVHADASVTLEQDLQRRDLTINAMAQDEHGSIIDPFGGQRDLQQGILRHVSPAFAEDPVRILRTARFAARYGFAIAPETMQLMRDMVAAGEVDALVAERVWQEFAKGLMEREPRKMIEVLRDCGALAILLPEVEALFGVPQRADYHPEVDSGEHTLLVLQCAADLNLSLAERYAALLHDLGKALTPPDVLPKHIGHDRRGVEPIRAVNQRWRVPKHCAELAELVCAFHIRFHQIRQIKQASKIIKLLKECDAFRRPERVQAALNVCLADQQGRLGKQNSPYPQREHIMALIAAAQQINAGEIAQQYTSQPAQISKKIDEARAMQVKALQAAFREKMTEH